jgi:hypothetical protein
MYLQELTKSVEALEDLMDSCIQILAESLTVPIRDEVWHFFVTEGLMFSKSRQGTLVELVRYVTISYPEDSQAWEKILARAEILPKYKNRVLELCETFHIDVM